MLKRLYVKNFTVFAEANFEFGPGLNVVVGTNGTGKSHVLKLGYAVLSTFNNRLIEAKKDYDFEQVKLASKKPPISLRKPKYWTTDEKIAGVFRPTLDQLEQLIRRGSIKQESLVKFDFGDLDIDKGSFIIANDSTGERPPVINKAAIPRLVDKFSPPIFIPAKEILTLGWMLSASRQFKLPMDETYLDLLTQLSGLSLQNPEPAAAAAIVTLTEVLGGEVEEQNGSFFLVYPKEERMEMNLVAEGLRKFGTLQKLLSNGSLTPRATLFWDEPEANLNPVLLRKLAAVLAELAWYGFQIILATHSLFLLNELHILAQSKQTPMRYFGLYRAEGGETKVEQTDDLETLNHLAALDEELAQTARFQRVLNSEDDHAEHP